MSTYEMRLVCNNCGEDQRVEVPVGMLLKEFLKNYDCRLCQCKNSFTTKSLDAGYYSR